jgi:hypothetical protein
MHLKLAIVDGLDQQVEQGPLDQPRNLFGAAVGDGDVEAEPFDLALGRVPVEAGHARTGGERFGRPRRSRSGESLRHDPPGFGVLRLAAQSTARVLDRLLGVTPGKQQLGKVQAQRDIVR